MKLESLLAATICLAVPLSQTVTAQDRGGAESRASTVAALEEVQRALHAAETAQVKLLGAGERGKAFAEVNRAVRSLSAAREILRARLGVKGMAPDDPALIGTGKESVGARRVAARPVPRVVHPKLDQNKVNLAIARGLKWLHSHQDQNGRWDADAFMKHDKNGTPSDDPGNPVHDVGVTGLALLAFLGAGNTTQSGPYKEVVNKAVDWLQKQQGLDGMFGTAASHDFIYDHAIAAYAMCEAFGISRDDRLKKSAQGGIDYLDKHRNPYAMWRYQPRDNDNDSSVTSWCLKAYRSASDFDLKTNRVVMRIGANYMEELTDPTTGTTGYTKRGEMSSRHPGDHGRRFPIEKGEALTAAGLSTRFVLGQSPENKMVMKLAADRLLAKPPTAAGQGAIDHYYWYHGTTAMQQMGGKYWDQWSRAVGAAMLSTQRRGGSVNGSWDSAGAWGEDGGRVYSTSLLVMALQVAAADFRLRRNR